MKEFKPQDSYTQAEMDKLDAIQEKYTLACSLYQNSMFNCVLGGALAGMGIGVIFFMDVWLIHWAGLTAASFVFNFNANRLSVKAKVIGVAGDKLYEKYLKERERN